MRAVLYLSAKEKDWPLMPSALQIVISDRVSEFATFPALACCGARVRVRGQHFAAARRLPRTHEFRFGCLGQQGKSERTLAEWYSCRRGGCRTK